MSGAVAVAIDRRASGEVAASADRVFWVDRGPHIRDSIRSVEVAGATPQTVYQSSPSAAIEYLVASGESLYWTEVDGSSSHPSGTRIKSMKQEGGDPSVLFESGDTIFTFAVGGEYLYFIEGLLGGRLTRVPVGGGPGKTLSVAALGVAANAQSACWVDLRSKELLQKDLSEDVACRSVASDDVTIVSRFAQTDQAFPLIAMNDTHVVWTTAEPRTPSEIWLRAAPIAGGVTVILESGEQQPFALAVDETAAYVFEGPPSGSSATIVRRPLDGSAGATLASGLAPDATSPSAATELALAGTSAFWTDANAGVILSTSTLGK